LLTNNTYSNATDFYGNYANVLIDSSYGYINKKGLVKLFKEYDRIHWFDGDVGVAQKHSKFGLINRRENVISPLIYEGISFPYKGYFSAKKNNERIIINKKGEEISFKNIILDYSPVYK